MRAARAIAWALAGVACLVGFFELAEDFAYSPKVLAFDRTVSAAAVSLRMPWLDAVMMVVTILGGTIFVSIATAITVGAAARRGRVRAALYALCVLLVGVSLSTVMKGVFERPRPPVSGALIHLPASFSFPSGHSMGSLCLAWVVCYLVLTSNSASRNVRIATVAGVLVYALAVGFSRVYLGVHYPSDVLASWLLGAGWIALVTSGYTLWTGRKLANAG